MAAGARRAGVGVRLCSRASRPNRESASRQRLTSVYRRTMQAKGTDPVKSEKTANPPVRSQKNGSDTQKGSGENLLSFFSSLCLVVLPGEP